MITPNNVYLHTDGRYSNAFSQKVNETGMKINIDDNGAHADFLQKVLTEEDLRFNDTKLGIERTMSLGEYRQLQGVFNGKIKFVETESLVMGLRAIKDSAEIEYMRKAQAITDAAYTHIIDFVKPGITEVELQNELESFCIAQGAEGMSFDTIIATGPNAANPHALPGERKVEQGHCVLFDFGVLYNQYCSDMTRMVFVGMPDKDSKMYKAYQAVRAANEECSNMIKAGVSSRSVHEFAEKVLADHGFANCMNHGLGHAVGMEIHEDPSLGARNDFTLQAGNVVTCEPGAYFAGDFGIRIEDCGLITETGYDKFTQSTHDMVVV